MHTSRPVRILSQEEIQKLQLSEQQKEKIRQALYNVYFKNHDHKYLETDQGKRDIDANVHVRYTHSLQHVVPWTLKHLDLRKCTVLEIGCGTGSSSSAFAHFCKKLVGYDIDADSINAARERCRVLKQRNAKFELVSPEQLIPEILRHHKPDTIDVVLLFAVIEHQTIDERITALKTSWDLLREGGLLIVVETPNRFSYWDTHTTDLPYFHLLPVELAVKYVDRSYRKNFGTSLKESFAHSFADAYLNFTRWGLGASYHEFELALGNAFIDNLVCEGFEEEILPWFGINEEEELLRLHFQKKKLPIPLGYSRQVLNLMFQKTNDTSLLRKSEAKAPPYAIISPSDLAV